MNTSDMGIPTQIWRLYCCSSVDIFGVNWRSLAQPGEGWQRVQNFPYGSKKKIKNQKSKIKNLEKEGKIWEMREKSRKPEKLGPKHKTGKLYFKFAPPDRCDWLR